MEAATAAQKAPGHWVELRSGLCYRDLRLSDGDAIASGDVAVVNYQVALGDRRDGEPAWIQSSWETKPFRFRVGAGEVLKGVDVAVVGMCVAGERRMILTADWAFGERGLAQLVPGHSTLTIQVYIVMKEERPEEESANESQ